MRGENKGKKKKRKRKETQVVTHKMHRCRHVNGKQHNGGEQNKHLHNTTQKDNKKYTPFFIHSFFPLSFFFFCTRPADAQKEEQGGDCKETEQAHVMKIYLTRKKIEQIKEYTTDSMARAWRSNFRHCCFLFFFFFFSFSHFSVHHPVVRLCVARENALQLLVCFAALAALAALAVFLCRSRCRGLLTVLLLLLLLMMLVALLLVLLVLQLLQRRRRRRGQALGTCKVVVAVVLAHSRGSGWCVFAFVAAEA